MSYRPDALPPESDELQTGTYTRTAERSVIVPPPAEAGHDEEITRIRVDPEDRLAFRVGVNILTLVLIGVGAWLIWRNFFAGN